MGSHPVNLSIRFLLELMLLFACFYWGWKNFENLPKYILSIGIPTLLMVIWGVFAVLGDPSRSGKAPIPTNGFIRLIIELLFFSFGTYCLYATFSTKVWVSFLVLFVLHYLLSYDRIIWLLKQ